MHIAAKAALILALLLPAAAGADVGPPQPPPPPPPGAGEATVMGLTLEQQWLYWRGRRWAVVITGCADQGSAACARATAGQLLGCHIVGVAGRPIADGDLQAVVDAAAGAKPLTITVDACRERAEATLEP